MKKVVNKCPKCGESQKSYKKTDSWEFFKCGEKCKDCGVEFEIIVEDSYNDFPHYEPLIWGVQRSP